MLERELLLLLRLSLRELLLLLREEEELAEDELLLLLDPERRELELELLFPLFEEEEEFRLLLLLLSFRLLFVEGAVAGCSLRLPDDELLPELLFEGCCDELTPCPRRSEFVEPELLLPDELLPDGRRLGCDGVASEFGRFGCEGCVLCPGRFPGLLLLLPGAVVEGLRPPLDWPCVGGCGLGRLLFGRWLYCGGRCGVGDGRKYDQPLLYIGG